MKRRIGGIFLVLTLCLTLLPTAVLAAEPETAPASETADFTAPDGGAAAITLLNAAKGENAEDSTWDASSKTLTLKGLHLF